MKVIVYLVISIRLNLTQDLILSLISSIVSLIWIYKYAVYCYRKLFFLIFTIIFEYDHLCSLFLQNPVDFDIVHLHPKLGHPFSYRTKDIAHYNCWVPSYPINLNGSKLLFYFEVYRCNFFEKSFNEINIMLNMSVMTSLHAASLLKSELQGFCLVLRKAYE